MTRAFTTTWRSVVDVYNDLFPMVGMNLIWFVLSLVVFIPFAALVLLVSSIFVSASTVGLLPLVPLVFLLIIGPSPASAGLHFYANQTVKDERVSFGLFWQGLRSFWAKSLLLFTISVVLTIVMICNIAFYFGQGNQILQIVGIVFLYVVYFWTTLQFYLLPLLIEQEDKSLKVLYRNAAILAADSPLFTLLFFLLTLILSAIGFVLPILVMLVLGALIVVMENRATQMLLEKFRARRDRAG